jgi:hypothetical protein
MRSGVRTGGLVRGLGEPFPRGTTVGGRDTVGGGSVGGTMRGCFECDQVTANARRKPGKVSWPETAIRSKSCSVMPATFALTSR